MTVASRSHFRRLAAHARWLAIPCAAGLLLPLLGRSFPASANRLTWLLDLAAHWQSLYALFWFALCLLCAVHARRWLLMAPLALLPVFTASRSLPDADADDPVLVIVAANVYVGNRDPAPLVAWLRAHPADVVVLSEISEPYVDALSHALGSDYRYRALYPRRSPFGIGIVSRLPLRGVSMIDDAFGIQTLAAEVRIGTQPVRIVAAHPMPPHARVWHNRRDALLQTIASDSDTPLILAGDLNATPWSTALIGAARGGLSRTTSLAPTWPHRGHGALGIPIDHVLASRHWRRSAASRGPEIGSDHFPVRVALQWADSQGNDRPQQAYARKTAVHGVRSALHLDR
jgi:endonuclease/exonuclease/phosphatase (EEP) superfamily protein YafD